LAHFACIYLSHLPIVSLMSCPCLFESCRRMNQGFAPIIVQSTAEGTIGASLLMPPSFLWLAAVG
jgi:hypothetical protein